MYTCMHLLHTRPLLCLCVQYVVRTYLQNRFSLGMCIQYSSSPRNDLHTEKEEEEEEEEEET